MEESENGDSLQKRLRFKFLESQELKFHLLEYLDLLFNIVNTVSVLAYFPKYWHEIRIVRYLNSAEETIAE